ncbi:MAG: hypothetical protein ABJM86_00085 [Hyphomicrobiales bacterium]
MSNVQAQNTVSNDNDKTVAEKKRAALDLVLDAWSVGIEKGIDGEILAHASLFAALSDLIELYGEEAVANLAARLPQRIHNGEFTLVRQIQ